MIHSSETYTNFEQWATVSLEALHQCSDVKKWHYRAQVDTSLNGADAIKLNDVDEGHISNADWPTGPQIPPVLPPTQPSTQPSTQP